MPRVRRGAKRRQKRKKILARAKGYFQTKSKLYRQAKEAVDRSQKFAYIGRRLKKRDFRALWITRIGAATDQHGLSYSRFIHGLKLAGIELNRKMLAELAVSNADGFRKLVELAKAALEAPPKAPPSSEAPEAAPEASQPETPAKEKEAAPKKPRARKKPAATGKSTEVEAPAAPAKKPAATDKSTESEAPAAPAKKSAKKRAPAKKKPTASDDDSADT